MIHKVMPLVSEYKLNGHAFWLFKMVMRAGVPRRTTIMSNKAGRSVFQRENGDWVNKRNDAEKAGSLHTTQKDAWDAARQMLQQEGGGELTVMGRHGTIVSKDTISPGPESRIRDTEH